MSNVRNVEGPLQLASPIVLASGLLGDTPEKLRAAYDAGAGAVVTKSVTLYARKGNPEQKPVREGEGWLNSVGLKNPGAKAFASRLGRPDYPVIVSLAGSIPDEFTEMARMFGGVAAFELNMSCPNAAGFGHDIGHDPTLTGDVVSAMKECTDLPIFVKVGIKMRESVEAAIKAGADGITAINTVPVVDDAAKMFTAGRCGRSGPPIKSEALEEVSYIANKYHIPVMGCGGVCSGADALSFLQAGAWAVQVGSAAMMDGVDVLGRIAAELPRPADMPAAVPGSGGLREEAPLAS